MSDIILNCDWNSELNWINGDGRQYAISVNPYLFTDQNLIFPLTKDELQYYYDNLEFDVKSNFEKSTENPRECSSVVFSYFLQTYGQYDHNGNGALVSFFKGKHPGYLPWGANTALGDLINSLGLGWLIYVMLIIAIIYIFMKFKK